MKQVPHSPNMKSKLLLTYLQNKSENLEDIMDVILLLRESSKNLHIRSGTRNPGMHIYSMVISIHVMVLVTRLWTIHSTKEEALDYRLVTILSMLLQIVIHWDATLVVVLALNPMYVKVQEEILWEGSHTHQQGKTMDLGRRMTKKVLKAKFQMISTKDALRYG